MARSIRSARPGCSVERLGDRPQPRRLGRARPQRLAGPGRGADERGALAQRERLEDAAPRGAVDERLHLADAAERQRDGGLGEGAGLADAEERLPRVRRRSAGRGGRAPGGGRRGSGSAPRARRGSRASRARSGCGPAPSAARMYPFPGRRATGDPGAGNRPGVARLSCARETAALVLALVARSPRCGTPRATRAPPAPPRAGDGAAAAGAAAAASTCSSPAPGRCAARATSPARRHGSRRRSPSAPAAEDARLELADLLVADGRELARAADLLAGVRDAGDGRLHLVRARLAEAREDDARRGRRVRGSRSRPPRIRTRGSGARSRSSGSAAARRRSPSWSGSAPRAPRTARARTARGAVRGSRPARRGGGRAPLARRGAAGARERLGAARPVLRAARVGRRRRARRGERARAAGGRPERALRPLLPSKR